MTTPLDNARIQNACEEALGRLRDKVFMPQCELTLVMRNPLEDDGDGDLVITDDDLKLVERSVRYRREQDEAGENPNDHPLMISYEEHCDSIIMRPTAPMALRWWLFVNRLPAIDKMLCRVNGIEPKLFAKCGDELGASYGGKWVRVVMASRFGDVGITTDLDADHGYSARVRVKNLTEFTDQDPRAATETKSDVRCCHVDCGGVAEYSLHPVPAENFEDNTETCAKHIGDFLGTTGKQKVDHYVVVPL